jgi:hypothetical protein
MAINYGAGSTYKIRRSVNHQPYLNQPSHSNMQATAKKIEERVFGKE